MGLSKDFPELPRGPLDVYRKMASFSWKEMLRFMEGDEIIAFKVTCIDIFLVCCVCVCLSSAQLRHEIKV